MSRWTTEEDITLVRAWKSTSTDASVGTDQSSETFWSKISSLLSGRDVQACKNRWNRIRLHCQYWVNAVKQIEDLNQSGKSAEDLEEDAMKVYKTFIESYNAGKPKQHQYSTSFNLSHCYELLKDCPKFCPLKKAGDDDGDERSRPEG